MGRVVPADFRSAGLVGDREAGAPVVPGGFLAGPVVDVVFLSDGPVVGFLVTPLV